MHWNVPILPKNRKTVTPGVKQLSYFLRHESLIRGLKNRKKILKKKKLKIFESSIH